ncbi:MAG: M18 family aminopeptidase [Lachnospiraceae bacterium]|nr:M18 family aminopeptidase [Lachnospiraceae bacterium]
MFEREMMDFIDRSPVNFYAVRNVALMLDKAGFVRLNEGDVWHLQAGGRYYTTRNDSSLIAFRIPEGEACGFMMVSAHCDSPCFKVKENPESDVLGKYTRISVEGYGGMLMAPWFDRPVSVAGRAYVRTNSGLEMRLVNIDRDILMFPSLAIHMDRKANDGHEYKKNVDMVPLFGGECEKGALKRLVAESLEVEAQDIVSTDLFTYNRDKCRLWGANEEFLSGSRLDDLMCAYAGAKAFVDSDEAKNVQVLAIFDNEEVGSLTRQGACSTFMADVLKRVSALYGGDDAFRRMIANSLNVSADNAHAVHPNFPELTDPNNRCYLNGGVVIKKNASQKYASDAYSRALFIKVCEEAGVKYQCFENRPDMPGGSTLGNLLNYSVSVATVDVGLAQLAMHSPYETAGREDVDSLVEVLKQLYKMHIKNLGVTINVEFKDV